MASKGRHGLAATAEEICSAIQDLTDVEWVRLRRVAEARLWGTDFHGADALINETIARFLAGTRSWPADVPFVVCLMNAMRSVANGDRERSQQQHEIPASELCGDDDGLHSTEGGPLASITAEDAEPEMVLSTEERRRAAATDIARIETYFQDDEEVGWILMGIEDSCSPAEIQAASGMSQTTYETARKRMRRGLERVLRQRSQS